MKKSFMLYFLVQKYSMKEIIQNLCSLSEKLHISTDEIIIKFTYASAKIKKHIPCSIQSIYYQDMDEKFLNGQEFSRIHHEANPKTMISSEKKKLGSKKRKKGQEIKTKKKNCSKRSGAKKEEDSGEKKKIVKMKGVKKQKKNQLW